MNKIMLERKVYNNDDITFFSGILTFAKPSFAKPSFAKPSCDNVLQNIITRGLGKR